MQDPSRVRFNTSHLVLLLGVYAILRLLFWQVTWLKTGFIYPTGLLLQWFSSTGEYVASEWLFVMHNTRFVLGPSCSGTTFFSLLTAYLTLRIVTHRISIFWLASAFVLTLLANAVRVLSSMYLHTTMDVLGFSSFQDSAHVMTGTVSFLCTLIMVAYMVERQPYPIKLASTPHV